MKSFRLDPGDIVLGSVLRRAMPSLLSERGLRYDPDRSAVLNDLVFGEILGAGRRSFEPLTKNFLERLYPAGNAVRLRNEPRVSAPCVAVVGNRYAPPQLIGGLTNPLTGLSNGEIKGGAVVDSLFGVNAIGYVNHEAEPQERVRIKIHGVIVDDGGQSLNARTFRERFSDRPKEPGLEPHLIIVCGYSTDTGKTTCAWALVSELQKRGFAVTMEKKTGTACCRDWLRCYADPRVGALEHMGDELLFDPDRFPARDFVDGVGVASDVSIDAPQFVPASIRYTRGLLGHYRPDFHVIELADSISHMSNSHLLRSEYFRRRLRTLVYVSTPTHEAVSHFRAYLRALGYHQVQVLLSGPLANEAQYTMARDEIRARLGLPIRRSAIPEAGRWIPDGSELADAVLEGSPRRRAAERRGDHRDV